MQIVKVAEVKTAGGISGSVHHRSSSLLVGERKEKKERRRKRLLIGDVNLSWLFNNGPRRCQRNRSGHFPDTLPLL